MLDLTKYRELDAKVARALGWTEGGGLWHSPDGFNHVSAPPQFTNLDARCFDLMHEHKIWVWQNPGDTDFMAEYMRHGVKMYHLEYGRDHHGTGKIAMRCAVLNALLKQLAKD